VAGERGHDQAVGGFEPKARCLAAQRADLLAEQDQFYVLRPLPTATHLDDRRRSSPNADYAADHWVERG
jgi:hypothetical protein